MECGYRAGFYGENNNGVNFHSPEIGIDDAQDHIGNNNMKNSRCCRRTIADVEVARIKTFDVHDVNDREPGATTAGDSLPSLRRGLTLLNLGQEINNSFVYVNYIFVIYTRYIPLPLSR